MTLPHERFRAVKFAEEFLRDLAFDKTLYPRVPQAVRKEAAAILRHYPSQYEMGLVAERTPDMFSESDPFFKQS